MTINPIRNKFTGEVARVIETPINHAYLVRIDGSTTELHRGNELTAYRYLDNLVQSQSYIWEYVTA